ncbi:MAG: sigma-70 family RNA polymerase sigma factor [Verrucomicrobiales bacterium]|nr:sigma-70 family RNA polymerase sigma factor [Verrucomicrobiales bacterium]
MKSELRGGAAEFRTTHWSVVLRAGREDEPRSDEALERLCRAYWHPIYAFLRRRGYPPHEAEDLVQGFFAGLLRRKGLQKVDPAHGRFRSFLLASLNNHLSHERDKGQRQKRGGGLELISLDAPAEEDKYLSEPGHELTPERLFEKRWAEVVLERVVNRVRADFVAAGHEERFHALKDFLLGDPADASYADAGEKIGLSVSAVTSAIYRMRSRYREFFRDEIAQTVSDSAEVDEEIRYLARALAS